MTPEPIAAWLRRQLTASGITAAQLARQTGLTKGQLSETLNGIHSLTMPNARALARALGTRLPPLYKPWHKWNRRPKA